MAEAPLTRFRGSQSEASPSKRFSYYQLEAVNFQKHPVPSRLQGLGFGVLARSWTDHKRRPSLENFKTACITQPATAQQDAVPSHGRGPIRHPAKLAECRQQENAQREYPPESQHA